jgi:hypothetical protein
VCEANNLSNEIVGMKIKVSDRTNDEYIEE